MKKLALNLFALAISFFASETAIACSCDLPGIDTEEKFRAVVATSLNGANAVFSGEVVEMDTFTVKFKIEKVWKGNFKDELIMITGVERAEDGSDVSSTCDYDFELHKKYLVFAYGAKDKLKASKCSWTSILDERERFVNELDRLKQRETDSQQPNAGINVDLFQSRRNLTTHSTGAATVLLSCARLDLLFRQLPPG